MSTSAEAVAHHWAFAIFLIVAIGLCYLTLASGRFLGGRARARSKDISFESGIDSVDSVHLRLPVRFHLVAILFAIFNVEAPYLFAWSTPIRENGWVGLVKTVVFIFALLVGPIYLVRIDALGWTPTHSRRERVNPKMNSIANRQRQPRGVKMDYTLTCTDPNGEGDRHPLQGQEIITDSLEQEADKNVSMGKLNDMVNWGCRSSVWSYNFGLSCCYVEMMTSFTAAHGVACFGAEALCASPHQADLMVVVGTCFTRMTPVIQRLHDQMLEPKWVISMGACANSGGVHDIYSVVQDANKFISIDMYIPGYPSRPEAYIQASMLLQESTGEECRPFSWMASDQDVYRAST